MKKMKKMKNTVIIIDQQSIPASFGAESLFVNYKHIVDADNAGGEIPIHDIADNLAEVLGCNVESYSLTEKELATYIAKSKNETKKFKDCPGELDDWIQGYTNDDLIGAIKEQGLET